MKNSTKPFEPRTKLLARALAILAGLIFFLIVVGGLVRNLGAGLSCPDWPLCQGEIIPQFDLRVFAEYFHRLFAAAVSTLTLVLSVVIFIKPEFRSKLGRPALLALGLLFSQVILGGLTVLKLLQSEIVTLHLATGTLFFGTVLYMALKSKTLGSKPSGVGHRRLFELGVFTIGAIYVQIILGGIVSSHYAGLACPDFPTCNGKWWPTMTGNIPYQVIHRLGAGTVFLVTIYFALKLINSKKFKPKAVPIILALFVQIGLGIANVLFRLPVPMSVAHLAVAECLIALILMSTYEIRYS